MSGQGLPSNPSMPQNRIGAVVVALAARIGRRLPAPLLTDQQKDAVARDTGNILGAWTIVVAGDL